MSEACDDCGEPIVSDLEKVGEPVSISCSIGEFDEVGVIIMRHKESGECRVLLEALEYFPVDDLPQELFTMADELCRFAKAMLLPADARKLAAALLDMADKADGLEPVSGIDWDEMTK